MAPPNQTKQSQRKDDELYPQKQDIDKDKSVLKIFEEDIQIAKLLINRDRKTTTSYFYEQSYPLFKAIYDNYETDCACCKEFIDEIYMLIMYPSKTTGKCKLESFRGESTLRSWLRSVCIHYCYRKHWIKRHGPTIVSFQPPTNVDEKGDNGSDRGECIYGSIEMDLSGINRSDAETLLNLMPNTRYREVMRLCHLKQWTHEEVAKKLGITKMYIYYNLHKRAINQFNEVCKKEEWYG